MHEFSKLIVDCTNFTLKEIERVETKIIKELENGAKTSSVKGLQMLQLQRAIFAVGIFSMFDAEMQDQLSCKDGFSEVSNILNKGIDKNLSNQFRYYRLAINVLKHGNGRSYNELLKDFQDLPFKIKQPGEFFFFEGDVSEINTLIEVDSAFFYND